MTKKQLTVRVIVETALLTAFAFILDYLQGIICDFIPFWPNGGSVGIAMVPIFILSIRRGVLPGLLGGLILGLLDMIDGVWISPVAGDSIFLAFLCILLDYILGWTLVGLAGIFSKKIKEAKDNKSLSKWAIISIITGGFARLFIVFLSGSILWSKGTEILGITVDLPWALYSLLYNSSYLIPSILLCIAVIIPIIVSKAKFIIKPESE
jgi:thiamine transporter